MILGDGNAMETEENEGLKRKMTMEDCDLEREEEGRERREKIWKKKKGKMGRRTEMTREE